MHLSPSLHGFRVCGLQASTMHAAPTFNQALASVSLLSRLTKERAMSKYKKGDLLRWEGKLPHQRNDLLLVLGIVNDFAGNQCYNMSYLEGGFSIRESINNIESNPTITLVARGQ